MDNEKIVELANNFHAEINSTKDEFTKKIDLKFNQIEQKVELSNNNFSNIEIYNENITKFSENFIRIKNTIGAQTVAINRLAAIYKILVVIVTIYSVILLIILFKSPNSNQKTAKKAITSSPTISASHSPAKKATENSIDDYNKLIKDYKLAYVKAINSEDRSDLDKFISIGSSFDKYITEKLSSMKNLKLDLKDSKVEKAENKDGYIYIYVLENLGVKESGKTSFEYNNYKIKYTIKKSDDAYTFEKQENLP